MANYSDNHETIRSERAMIEIKRLIRTLTIQTVGVISLTLFLVFTLAGWFMDYKNESDRITQIDQKARVLLSSLREIMKDSSDQKHDRISSLFNDLKTTDEFLRIELVDNSGIIRFSSDPKILGKPHDITSSYLENNKHDLKMDLGIQRSVDRSWDHNHVQYIIPILNEERCKKCHDDGNTYRGALVADYTLRPIRATMWHFRYELTALLVIVIAFFATLIYLVLRSYTYRPLSRIAWRLQGVAAGRYDERTGYREFGIFMFINQVVDQMATQLKQLHQSMEQEIRSRTASLEESRNQQAEQSERMIFLLDNSPAGIVGIDPNSTFHIANQRALELIGNKGTEEGNELSLSHPLLAAITGKCGDGQPFEHLGKTWNGEVESPPERFFEFYAATLTAPTGDPLFLVSFTESTERHATERQLARQERLAATGQLAAGVAHEIGNPLSAIFSIVQLATKQPDEDHMSHYLELVTHHISRIRRIVSDLTAFARIPDELAIDTNINEVVSRAIEIACFDKNAAAVKINVRTGGGPIILKIPRDRLEQAILNIALNAFDALKDVEDRRLDVEVIDKGKGVNIILRDNGPGIAAEIRERIFEPFFTTKLAGKGTGLGLSVTYRAIRDMGGSIELNCPIEGGAKFTIHLPKGNTDA